MEVKSHFQCPNCNASFAKKNLLDLHLFGKNNCQNKHEFSPPGKSRYTCKRCEKAFEYKSELIVHEHLKDGCTKKTRSRLRLSTLDAIKNSLQEADEESEMSDGEKNASVEDCEELVAGDFSETDRDEEDSHVSIEEVKENLPMNSTSESFECEDDDSLSQSNASSDLPDFDLTLGDEGEEGKIESKDENDVQKDKTSREVLQEGKVQDEDANLDVVNQESASVSDDEVTSCGSNKARDNANISTKKSAPSPSGVSSRHPSETNHDSSTKPSPELVLSKCEICGFQKDVPSVISHIQRAHMNSSFIISRLSTFKTGKKEKRLDLKRNRESGLYKCPYCDKTDSLKNNMTVHIRIHTGEHPHKCSLCDFEAKRQHRMVQHIWREHKTDATNFCMDGVKDVPDATQGTKFDQSVTDCPLLADLNKTGTDRLETRHDNSCQPSTPKEGDLDHCYPSENLQISSTAGDASSRNKCTCKVCGFKDKMASVVDHVSERHSGTILGISKLYTFTPGQKERKLYLKKDAESRFYKCPYCTWKSHRLDQVIRHVRCHTGEKPYECNLCGVKNSRKYRLATHIWNEHEAAAINVCILELADGVQNTEPVESLTNNNVEPDDMKPKSGEQREAVWPTSNRLGPPGEVANEGGISQAAGEENVSIDTRTKDVENHLGNVTMTNGEQSDDLQDQQTMDANTSSSHRTSKSVEHPRLIPSENQPLDRPYLSNVDILYSPSSSEMIMLAALLKASESCCPYCDKRFVSAEDVVLHHRQHTGEEPYQCMHCEYKSSHKPPMVTHVKSQHKAKAPPTNYFSLFNFKTVSVKINIDFEKDPTTKKYICCHCQKESKTLKQARLHGRHHTKPYRCNTCQFTASRRPAMLEHIEEVHPDLMENSGEKGLNTGEKVANASEITMVCTYGVSERGMEERVVLKAGGKENVIGRDEDACLGRKDDGDDDETESVEAESEENVRFATKTQGTTEPVPTEIDSMQQSKANNEPATSQAEYAENDALGTKTSLPKESLPNPSVHCQPGQDDTEAVINQTVNASISNKKSAPSSSEVRCRHPSNTNHDSLIETIPELVLCKCKICGFQKDVPSVIAHIQHAHMNSSYIISRLSTFKPGKKEQKLDLKKDDESGLFECPYCNKTDSYKNNVRVHIRIHTGEHPYKCGLCDFEAKRQHRMVQHIWRKHKADAINFCMEGGGDVPDATQSTKPDSTTGADVNKRRPNRLEVDSSNDNYCHSAPKEGDHCHPSENREISSNEDEKESVEAEEEGLLLERDDGIGKENESQKVSKEMSLHEMNSAISIQQKKVTSSQEEVKTKPQRQNSETMLKGDSRIAGRIERDEYDFTDTESNEDFTGEDKAREGKPTKKTENDKSRYDSDEEPEENWVQCDSCSKWRQLPSDVSVDEIMSADTWFCRMNPDETYNKCEIPEQAYDKDEVCVYSDSGQRPEHERVRKSPNMKRKGDRRKTSNSQRLDDTQLDQQMEEQGNNSRLLTTASMRKKRAAEMDWCFKCGGLTFNDNCSGDCTKVSKKKKYSDEKESSASNNGGDSVKNRNETRTTSEEEDWCSDCFGEVMDGDCMGDCGKTGKKRKHGEENDASDGDSLKETKRSAEGMNWCLDCSGLIINGGCNGDCTRTAKKKNPGDDKIESRHKTVGDKEVSQEGKRSGVMDWCPDCGGLTITGECTGDCTKVTKKRKHSEDNVSNGDNDGEDTRTSEGMDWCFHCGGLTINGNCIGDCAKASKRWKHDGENSTNGDNIGGDCVERKEPKRQTSAGMDWCVHCGGLTVNGDCIGDCAKASKRRKHDGENSTNGDNIGGDCVESRKERRMTSKGLVWCFHCGGLTVNGNCIGDCAKASRKRKHRGSKVGNRGSKVTRRGIGTRVKRRRRCNRVSKRKSFEKRKSETANKISEKGDTYMKKNSQKPASASQKSCTDIDNKRFKRRRKVEVDTSADIIKLNHDYRIKYSLAERKMEQELRKTGSKQCPYCHKAFTSNSNVVMHTRIHTGASPFVCLHCSQRFATRQNLLMHIVKQHWEKSTAVLKKYTACCDNKGKSKLGKRLCSGKEKKPFYCVLCSSHFKNRHGVKQHIIIHHGKVVQKEVSEMQSLPSSSSTSNKSRKSCTNTGRRQQSLGDGDGESCVEGKLFKADMADKKADMADKVSSEKYPQRGYGSEIIRKPEDESDLKKRRTAPLSANTYDNIIKLNHDYCIEYSKAERKLAKELKSSRSKQCPYCDKKFGNTFNLISHCRVHIGVSRYVCLHCQHRCAHKQHMAIHMVSRHWEQSIAIKAFRNMIGRCEEPVTQTSGTSRRWKHSCTKQKTKPAYCAVCSLHFRDASNVKQHILLHHGDVLQNQMAELQQVESAGDEKNSMSETGGTQMSCESSNADGLDQDNVTTDEIARDGKDLYKLKGNDYESIGSESDAAAVETIVHKEASKMLPDAAEPVASDVISKNVTETMGSKTEGNTKIAAGPVTSKTTKEAAGPVTSKIITEETADPMISKTITKAAREPTASKTTSKDTAQTTASKVITQDAAELNTPADVNGIMTPDKAPDHSDQSPEGCRNPAIAKSSEAGEISTEGAEGTESKSVTNSVTAVSSQENSVDMASDICADDIAGCEASQVIEEAANSELSEPDVTDIHLQKEAAKLQKPASCSSSTSHKSRKIHTNRVRRQQNLGDCGESYSTGNGKPSNTEIGDKVSTESCPQPDDGSEITRTQEDKERSSNDRSDLKRRQRTTQPFVNAYDKIIKLNHDYRVEHTEAERKLAKELKSSGSNKCPYCDMKFNCTADAIRHCRVHLGANPYVCLHCQRGCNRKQTLVLHIVNHHWKQSIATKAFGNMTGRCEEPVRKTSGPFWRRNHSCAKQKTKPVYCVVCSLHFRDVSHVKEHILVHHGEVVQKQMAELQQVESADDDKDSVSETGGTQMSCESNNADGLDQDNVTTDEIARDAKDLYKLNGHDLESSGSESDATAVQTIVHKVASKMLPGVAEPAASDVISTDETDTMASKFITAEATIPLTSKTNTKGSSKHLTLKTTKEEAEQMVSKSIAEKSTEHIASKTISKDAAEPMVSKTITENPILLKTMTKDAAQPMASEVNDKDAAEPMVSKTMVNDSVEPNTPAEVIEYMTPYMAIDSLIDHSDQTLNKHRNLVVGASSEAGQIGTQIKFVSTDVTNSVTAGSSEENNIDMASEDVAGCEASQKIEEPAGTELSKPDVRDIHGVGSKSIDEITSSVEDVDAKENGICTDEAVSLVTTSEIPRMESGNGAPDNDADITESGVAQNLVAQRHSHNSVSGNMFADTEMGSEDHSADKEMGREDDNAGTEMDSKNHSVDTEMESTSGDGDKNCIVDTKAADSFLEGVLKTGTKVSVNISTEYDGSVVVDEDNIEAEDSTEHVAFSSVSSKEIRVVGNDQDEVDSDDSAPTLEARETVVDLGSNFVQIKMELGSADIGNHCNFAVVDGNGNTVHDGEAEKKFETREEAMDVGDNIQIKTEPISPEGENCSDSVSNVSHHSVSNRVESDNTETQEAREEAMEVGNNIVQIKMEPISPEGKNCSDSVSNVSHHSVSNRVESDNTETQEAREEAMEVGSNIVQIKMEPISPEGKNCSDSVSNVSHHSVSNGVESNKLETQGAREESMEVGSNIVQIKVEPHTPNDYRHTACPTASPPVSTVDSNGQECLVANMVLPGTGGNPSEVGPNRSIWLSDPEESPSPRIEEKGQTSAQIVGVALQRRQMLVHVDVNQRSTPVIDNNMNNTPSHHKRISNEVSQLTLPAQRHDTVMEASNQTGNSNASQKLQTLLLQDSNPRQSPTFANDMFKMNGDSVSQQQSIWSPVSQPAAPAQSQQQVTEIHSPSDSNISQKLQQDSNPKEMLTFTSDTFKVNRDSVDLRQSMCSPFWQPALSKEQVRNTPSQSNINASPDTRPQSNQRELSSTSSPNIDNHRQSSWSPKSQPTTLNPRPTVDFIYEPSSGEKLIWDEQILQCPMCSVEMTSTKDVMSHMRESHTLETPFRCCHCMFSAMNRPTMFDHVNRLHPASLFDLCHSFHICQWGQTAGNGTSKTCSPKATGKAACCPLSSDDEFYHCSKCSFKSFQLPLMADHVQKTHKKCLHVEVDPTTRDVVCPVCLHHWDDIKTAMKHRCTPAMRNMPFAYGDDTNATGEQRPGVNSNISGAGTGGGGRYDDPEGGRSIDGSFGSAPRIKPFTHQYLPGMSRHVPPRHMPYGQTPSESSQSHGVQPTPPPPREFTRRHSSSTEYQSDNRGVPVPVWGSYMLHDYQRMVPRDNIARYSVSKRNICHPYMPPGASQYPPQGGRFHDVGQRSLHSPQVPMMNQPNHYSSNRQQNTSSRFFANSLHQNLNASGWFGWYPPPGYPSFASTHSLEIEGGQQYMEPPVRCVSDTNKVSFKTKEVSPTSMNTERTSNAARASDDEGARSKDGQQLPV